MNPFADFAPFVFFVLAVLGVFSFAPYNPACFRKGPAITFSVRPARAEDARAYIRLMKAILREQPPVDTPYAPGEFDPDPLAMAQRIAQYPPNSLFLAAVNDDGGMIGALTCAGGTLKADRHSAEMGIYVAKDWRGRGVGAALMSEAVSWAQAHPTVQRLWLDVMSNNTRAIALYERFGFEHEGVRRRAYLRAGQPVDMLLMARLFDKYGTYPRG